MIDDLVLERQRKYIYSTLKTRLDSTEFNLVLPLQQIQTAYTMPLPLHKLPGYCFGYGEYWLKLVRQDVNTFNFDWAELINAKCYSFSPFEITAEIKQEQKLQHSHYTEHKQRYTNAQYFSDNNELINNLTEKCFAEFMPDKVIFIALRHIDYASMFFFTKFMPRSWHELRFYIDPQMHVHLFDANIGWFRSKKPEPCLEDFKKLLHLLFSLLGYEHKYKVSVISNSFILQLTRPSFPDLINCSCNKVARLTQIPCRNLVQLPKY